MKNIFKIVFAAVLLSILFVLSASAEGQIYTIEDKPSVFISDTEAITIDGTTYNTYPGLKEAFSALGADGGVIYVYGTVHDSTRTDLNRKPIDGSTAREHVLIRGWTSDAVLHFYTTLNINAGPTTFENFELHPATTNGTVDDTSDDGHGTWYMTGSENTVFGEGFKIKWVNQNSGSPRIYYRTYMSEDFTKNTNTEHRTVFASSSASFVAAGIGGYRDTFGKPDSDVPALVETVFDGLFLYETINAGFTDPADYQNRVYGNVNIHVNGGNFYKKQVKLLNINETNYHTGRTTVIFNNGMNDANDWTIAAGVDYVVNSVAGGTVEIKTQAPFGGTPVFKLTPKEAGKVPCIDGLIAVSENDDGEFLYTPEIPGTSTDKVTTDNPEGTVTETINVTWIDKPEETVEPQVYTINGKPSVFISDTAVINDNGMTYGAYPGLKEAFAALGSDGGVIYVYGTVNDSTRTDLGRVAIDGKTAREHVLIRGWTSDAVLHFYTTLNINAGPTTFENFELHPATTNGTVDDTSDDGHGTWYMTGSENTVFGEGLKIKWVNQNNGSPRIYYRTYMSEDFTRNTNTIHRTVFASKDASILVASIGGYRDSFGSASSDVPALAEIVFDNGFLYSAINAGFSDAADYMNRVYGNVNIYVNGGSFYTKKVNLSSINATNYHTGRTTVIFNNGMNTGWTIAPGVDYVVNSAVGGKVEIYEQAPFGGAPTFKFIPENEGYTALINGEIILEMDEVEGSFFYTPDIPLENDSLITTDNPEGTVTEVLDVEWIEIPDTCIVSFDANGGSGNVPESIECNRGEVYTLPDIDEVDLTMKDSAFLGWNTEKYADKALASIKVPDSEAVTLYAVWQHNGVKLSEDQDISDKGIGGIRVSTVDKSEFESNEAVASAVAALENEPLNIAGFEAVYAFDIKVFDIGENEISSFDELNFEIATDVLPTISVGECYVIYREDSFVPFTMNTDYLAFGDTECGTYTVAVMNAKTANYAYKTLSYNKASGEYVLALYFDGADASYGTFGLAFDTERLEFVSFTASENVILTGEDTGFGTYLCDGGIYRNTWEAANGSYINAADTPVEIGRLVFAAKSAITETSGLFAKAVFSDAETVLPEGVAKTVYDTDENVYLYAPMIPSAYVYCQPTTEVFELEIIQTESKFGAKIITEREYGKESANYAIITILSDDNAVLSLSEDELTVTESESGKAVLEISSELTPGEYTLRIQKNGYLTYTTEFTVDTAGMTLPDITLIGGDIKGSTEEICGDGTVDIDDFIRVLRGFSHDAASEVRTAVDLNEDGSVNVTDIAIVKKNFGKSSVGQ